MISGDVQIEDGVLIRSGEVRFRFLRSGGPGGQNVNKVATKVELLFDVAGSESLTSMQRSRVLEKLHSRIDAGGMLHISVDESRSQWNNRKIALDRFAALLRTALRRPRKRIATAPTGASRQRRVVGKKARGHAKTLRRRVQPDE